MKKLSSFLLLLLVVFTAQAQIQEPVKFKTELKTLSGAEAEIVLLVRLMPVGTYILPIWVMAALSLQLLM